MKQGSSTRQHNLSSSVLCVHHGFQGEKENNRLVYITESNCQEVETAHLYFG